MKIFYKLFSLAVCILLWPYLGLSQETCLNPTVTINTLPYNSPAHQVLSNNGFTTCGEGNNYNPNSICTSGTSANGEDALFLFAPKIGDECITITLKGTGNQIIGDQNLNASASITIFDACPELTYAKCVGQWVNNGATQLTISNLVLEAGRPYFILVDGGTACYKYVLSIAKGTCPTNPPPTGGPGTDCGNAIDITFPYVSVPGSTRGMKADYAPGSGCIAAGNTGEDVVYHFKLTNRTCVRYNVANMTGTGGVYLSNGCPGNTTPCLKSYTLSYPSFHGNVVEEMTLDPGDYYIIIKGNSSYKTLDFDLTVEVGNIDDNVVCQSCNDDENCASCKNAGFEKMTLNGWQGLYGTYGSPAATAGFQTGAIDNVTTRHTIVTKGHFDRMIPDLPVVPPDGHDYAVRLGNDNNGGQAEELVYQVTVDSNNTNFIYRYAVVLEFPNDGSHDETNKPFFSIKMEVGGANITCAEYSVFPNPGLPGFKNGGPSPKNGDDMLWKDWTTVNIPLINYIGQTAKITFITKDCLPGAHFGYAYLDAECARLEILRDSNLLCNPDTVTLTAPDGFKSYKWSNGATTRSVDVFDKGVYKVTCTTVTNCVIELETEIKYEKPPHPNFTWKFDCKDSVVTFTDASTPEGTNQINSWTWSFGDGDSAFVKNPKHKYTESGSYDVTLVLGSQAGCVGDTLIVLPIDVFMPQGNPNCIDTIRLCEKERLQLYADSIELTKYEWKGPSGFSSNLVNPFKNNILPKDSGYYKLKITIKDCVIKNDSTYVIIEPLKKVYITPDTIICEGDTAKLYCGGGKTYLWTPADGLTSTTIPNPKAGPDSTTTYYVTMFNDLCPDTTLDVEVRVLSGVVSMLMPDTLRACKGGSIPLQASTNGFDVFKWTGPGGYSNNTRLPTITNMTQAKVGYYRLDGSISTNTCLIGADSTWLDLYPDPIVTIDPKPGVICFGDSVQLTASGASTYVWTPTTGVSNPNIANPYFKPTVTTLYKVTGTSTDGCKGTDSTNVIVNPLPTPNLGPDILLCLGDTAYVKCTQQYDSLLWSTGATTDSIMLTNDATVSVTAYRLSCVGTDQLNAKFQDPGLFTLGPDTLLCKGTGYYTGIVLGQVDSTRWSDNVTTLNRTIDTAGTYYVDIYAGKCMYTDTIIVLFDSVPSISIPDSTVCKGTTVTMDATHPRALSYQWNTNANTPTYTATATGLYTVTLTSNRCVWTDSINITIVDPPKLNLGPDLNICAGDSVVFTSNVTGNKYLWSTGAITKSIKAKNQADYSLIVTYGPCTLYDTVTLNVQQPQPITIGPDITICEDQSVTINGPAGFDSYAWSNGKTTQNISPTVSGTYILVVVDKLCTATDTMVLVFDTIPDFKLPPDPTICKGDSVILTSPLNAPAYAWSTGETTKSIVVYDQGEYRLYIKNGTCDYEDTIFVNVVDPPALNIGPDKVVCIGTGVYFGQPIPSASYLWNTGATTPTIYDTTPGIYSVNVTFSVCHLTDTAELAVTLMPEPDLGPDQLVCEGTVVNLFANTFGETFKWNTPATGNNTSVVKEGYYTVHVTNGLCEKTDSMFLKVQPKHEVLLPPDVTICSNEKYDIVPVTDCTDPIFYWSTGASSRTITVRETGEYQLFVTNGVCTAIDTINVTVVPLPNAEPLYLLLCPDDSARIELPAGYDYFHEASMEPFTETMIYPKVEYNLVMFDRNGCRWPTSIKAELDMDCDRDVFVPNSFTPNGDGANDVFRVESFELKLIELLIFDRWGHLVYQTFDPAKGWDGRLKGDVCKTDVYEWKLIHEDVYNRRKIKIGHVNLLR